ncbi:MAG: hypothetical protein KAI39_09595, partial [Desulfobulbaceae bacterium]|nr:hypothetical protein [Desulfobulbaceae bacterium]
MMKKFILVSCILAFLTTPWVEPTHAKPGKEKPAKEIVNVDRDGPHDALTYFVSSSDERGYPENCISCHNTEAADMFGSTHYRWVGDPTDMVNNPGGRLQGKLTNAVNSYCINIKGDWP